VSTGRNRRDSRGDRRGREGHDSNLVEEVIKIYRVAKVRKGGRWFSFSALVVVGDQEGRVGCALGKALEVAEAIRKAFDRAKKDMVEVPIVNTTIPHVITGEADSASVLLKPASLGTGVIAGGAVRAIVEAAGYRNLLTKSLGSNNATNVAWATMDALRRLERAEDVAERRGLSVQSVL
jgi:small subunit ribosomal protein S5